jgi:hypothetical protein
LVQSAATSVPTASTETVSWLMPRAPLSVIELYLTV